MAESARESARELATRIIAVAGTPTEVNTGEWETARSVLCQLAVDLAHAVMASEHADS